MFGWGGSSTSSTCGFTGVQQPTSNKDTATGARATAGGDSFAGVTSQGATAGLNIAGGAGHFPVRSVVPRADSVVDTCRAPRSVPALVVPVPQRSSRARHRASRAAGPRWRSTRISPHAQTRLHGITHPLPQFRDTAAADATCASLQGLPVKQDVPPTHWGFLASQMLQHRRQVLW